MTPIAVSLLHRFRAAFADLSDLRDDEGRARILEAVASHMRSIAPLAAPEARAEVTRQLADGSSYHLGIVDGCLVLAIDNAHDGHATVAMTDREAQVIRLDVDSVMRSRS